MYSLNLADNKIRHLSATNFIGAPNLRHLYLYRNDIESIDVDAFANLPKLEQLYLQHNRLERLPALAFKNFLTNGAGKSITRIRLDGNPLVCDCEMMWLLQVELIIITGAECYKPEKISGKKLEQVRLDDLNCS